MPPSGARFWPGAASTPSARTWNACYAGPATEIKPVADLFVPIFFVTIGTKVQPAMLSPFSPEGHLWLALLLTAIAVVSKLVTGLGVYQRVRCAHRHGDAHDVRRASVAEGAVLHFYAHQHRRRRRDAPRHEHGGVERIGAQTLLDVHRHQISEEHRRGFISTSPSEIVGNSTGKPPALHTPRLTASATWRRWALQFVSSDHELAMPTTGHPSKTASLNPSAFEPRAMDEAIEVVAPEPVAASELVCCHVSLRGTDYRSRGSPCGSPARSRS